MISEKKTEDKHQYHLYLPEDLWQEALRYQAKYNQDRRNVGVISINNLMTTALRLFLDEN